MSPEKEIKWNFRVDGQTPLLEGQEIANLVIVFGSCRDGKPHDIKYNERLKNVVAGRCNKCLKPLAEKPGI